MVHLPLLVVLLLGNALGVQASTLRARNTEVILFRKPLPNESELMIIRGPKRSPADLVGIVTEAHLRQTSTAFSLRVEVHSRGNPPLPVATRLVLEEDIPGFGLGGFEVFDVLVDPGEIVLATAENGWIMLWQISPLGSSRGIYLRNADWTMSAAISPLDKTVVSVKLRWTKGHLVEAEVQDLRPYSKQRTRFLQVGKSWEFKRVQTPSVEKSKPSRPG